MMGVLLGFSCLSMFDWIGKWIKEFFEGKCGLAKNEKEATEF